MRMCSEHDCPHRASRRHLLGAAAALTLGWTALGCESRSARAVERKAPAGATTSAPLAPTATPGLPPSTANPDEALAYLMAGNQRFVEGRVAGPHRNRERLREVAPKQAPFAAFLGCADSRVPIEIIFDQGFGDLFVTRIAGNVADPAIIGSLEFGTLVLGARLLFVLGHTDCGAVSATIKGDQVPGQISTLYQHIRPAAKASGGNVERAVMANVKNQMEVLSEASPVVGQLVREGELKVVGGVYDLASGHVVQVGAS
jgi:carbonic anhydrase